MTIFDRIFGNRAETRRRQEEAEAIKARMLRKFPRLGVTLSQLKIEANERVKTAATDGHKVYYAPSFMDQLPEDQKVFILAHEAMHVAFNHILRSKGKNQKLWNIATDSVINQILKSEDLPMVEGGVDMPEAFNHSAEEMYEKLLKEKEEQKQNEQDNQKQKSDDGQTGDAGDSDNRNDDDDGNEQAGHDNHDIWKEAVKQAEKQQSKESGQPQDSENSQQSDDAYERNFADDNRKEREARVQEIRDALQKQKAKVMASMSQESERSLGAVGEAEAVLDWKKVLKKSIEIEQDRWSYRRSGADNDYMARVEELEDEDRSETEVMLDVSGSVNETLLKEFLRQLKPIIKTSKLKVGCFDEYFYGLSEIKTNRDIDNFKITAKSQWTENWDLAVKSFSKKKEVNKIVFTDGYPAPGTMPSEETRNINVIWLVYGNKNFKPVCGKVIHLDPNQIRQQFLSREAVSKNFGAER